jgi:hypothetical protein
MYHEGRGNHIGGATINNSSQGACLASERTRGLIESAADGISSEISTLSCLIDVMETKLQAIMQPEPPQPAGTASPSVAPSGGASPLAGYLLDQRMKIEHMQRRISALTARLDT